MSTLGPPRRGVCSGGRTDRAGAVRSGLQQGGGQTGPRCCVPGAHVVNSGSDGGFLLKISRTLISDPVGPSRTPMCPFQRPALVGGHSSEALSLPVHAADLWTRSRAGWVPLSPNPHVSGVCVALRISWSVAGVSSDALGTKGQHSSPVTAAGTQHRGRPVLPGCWALRTQPHERNTAAAPVTTPFHTWISDGMREVWL